jgi:tetratricopeptide (TPR) repeat protein
MKSKTAAKHNPTVHWLPGARNCVTQADLVDRLHEELAKTFSKALQVVVYGCFQGYTNRQESKIVLGVEVRYDRTIRTHIVKLGSREEVERDYNNWLLCGGPHVASRIFVSLDKSDLPPDRVAVVYENAFNLYDRREGGGVESLEQVVEWAVKDDKPDPRSVERVLRQIYGDLNRWFYRYAQPDSKAARAFYERRLQKAIQRWDSDPERRELRQDALWLLDPRPERSEPDYLDPYDYVSWALHSKDLLPETLVGRSHGDLHGRNILVGIQRGEAEYPAVFDYGEMGPANVLVWDFVKLEMELKIRLLQTLWSDQDAWSGLRLQPDQSSEPARRVRASQIRFAATFESLLAELGARIYALAPPASSEIAPDHPCRKSQKLYRALSILLSIRREAALYLGGRPGHRTSWEAEYYFALAVYGLCSAKWNYEGYQQTIALVSAGVAAARADRSLGLIKRALSEPPGSTAPFHPYPSYRVPCNQAYELWKTGQKSKILGAIFLLSSVVDRYRHAVPLLQQYALVLVEDGQRAEAIKLLDHLRGLCPIFGDFETLCRIGRTYKDAGDLAVVRTYVDAAALKGHPAEGLYTASFELYTEASQIKGDEYYPLSNAAALALILGKRDEAQETADRVFEICARKDLGRLSRDEQIWIAFSQGGAALIRKQLRLAAAHYRQALGLLTSDEKQMAQSSWNQVCRIWWVLHPEAVDFQPVIDEFQKLPFKLEPGPLHSCGLKDGPGGLHFGSTP